MRLWRGDLRVGNGCGLPSTVPPSLSSARAWWGGTAQFDFSHQTLLDKPTTCLQKSLRCLFECRNEACDCDRTNPKPWLVCTTEEQATQEEDPLAAILLPRKFQNKRDNREVMRKINADEGERWTQGGPCYGRDVVKRTAQTLRAKLLSWKGNVWLESQYWVTLAETKGE